MRDEPVLGPPVVADDEELDFWWELLASEVRMHRDKDGESQTRIYMSAMDGDPSLMQMLAWNVGEKLLCKEALDPVERLFAIQVMTRVMTNREAAKHLSGAAGKAGRPKNGARGLMAALLVIEAVKGGAKTIEEAIASVAEVPHAAADGRASVLGEDMIKKHWATWKDDALATMSMTESDLRAIQEENRRSK